MIASHHVAVIDIGKTNAKLAIVDPQNWRELAVRTMANRVLPGPPYPHFNVEAIWAFLLDSMRELNGQYPVASISITTHGASGVLLTEHGELAMPVLDYEHDGPDSMRNAYEALRPDFSETGSPKIAVGLNLGAQFFWQMQAFPDLATDVRHMLTYPQYWAYRLTGVMANEATSLGCHTDLWNPWKGTFSSMVETLDWTPLMAPVRKATDVLGPLHAHLADQLGLAAAVPVHCGIHDSNASLFPHLMQRQAPFNAVSTGTWVICMSVGGQPIEPDPMRDTLVNVNAFGEPVPSSRFMGGREFDLLMADRKAVASKNAVSRVLDGKIMLFPSVENQTGPFQGRQPEWTVEPHTLNDGEYYAVVSFYLALVTNVCLKLCGADGPIIVEGPFVQNNLYLRMLESVSGRRVIGSASSATGTSIGAAMLTIKNTDMGSQESLRAEFAATDDRFVAYAGLWEEHLSAREPD